MKRNLLKTLVGISIMSVMIAGVGVTAEEYYEDYTGENYYEDYYDNGYYGDDSYDDYYDDSYNGDDYYDEGYYDDGYYDDYYDDSYNGDDYYDDGYQEEYYEETPSTESAPVESSPAEESVGETEPVNTSDAAFAHQAPRTDIKRGNNKKREQADAEGRVHSYLTGKLIDQSIGFRRPVAVMINNIIDALPQDGISKASVIYEAPVEGEITRMMAIFEDLTDISKIGPVRSCRDYYIDFAIEFDAIYVHFGQAIYACELLNSDMVNNISGLEIQEAFGTLNGYAGEDIFFRTDDRPAPHNCYTSETGIKTAIERKGYSMDLDNSYMGHFKFAADGETVTYSDGKATHIVPHRYSNNPYFDYNPDTHKYYRSEYPDRSAGPAQIDQTTGEQVSVDNVIVQYCPIRNYDDHGYLDIDTNAGGDAILFTQGTYTKATWEKASDWGQAKYYDKNGEEIAINQGQTWVCIVQDTKAGDTSFE